MKLQKFTEFLFQYDNIICKRISAIWKGKLPELWNCQSESRRTSSWVFHYQRPNLCKPSNHPLNLLKQLVGSSLNISPQTHYNLFLSHSPSLLTLQFRYPFLYFSFLFLFGPRVSHPVFHWFRAPKPWTAFLYCLIKTNIRPRLDFKGLKTMGKVHFKPL